MRSEIYEILQELYDTTDANSNLQPGLISQLRDQENDPDGNTSELQSRISTLFEQLKSNVNLELQNKRNIIYQSYVSGIEVKQEAKTEFDDLKKFLAELDFNELKDIFTQPKSGNDKNDFKKADDYKESIDKIVCALLGKNYEKDSIGNELKSKDSADLSKQDESLVGLAEKYVDYLNDKYPNGQFKLGKENVPIIVDKNGIDVLNGRFTSAFYEKYKDLKDESITEFEKTDLKDILNNMKDTPRTDFERVAGAYLIDPGIEKTDLYIKAISKYLEAVFIDKDGKSDVDFVSSLLKDFDVTDDKFKDHLKDVCSNPSTYSDIEKQTKADSDAYRKDNADKINDVDKKGADSNKDSVSKKDKHGNRSSREWGYTDNGAVNMFISMRNDAIRTSSFNMVYRNDPSYTIGEFMSLFISRVTGTKIDGKVPSSAEVLSSALAVVNTRIIDFAIIKIVGILADAIIDVVHDAVGNDKEKIEATHGDNPTDDPPDPPTSPDGPDDPKDLQDPLTSPDEPDKTGNDNPTYEANNPSVKPDKPEEAQKDIDTDEEQANTATKDEKNNLEQDENQESVVVKVENENQEYNVVKDENKELETNKEQKKDTVEDENDKTERTVIEDKDDKPERISAEDDSMQEKAVVKDEDDKPEKASVEDENKQEKAIVNDENDKQEKAVLNSEDNKQEKATVEDEDSKQEKTTVEDDDSKQEKAVVKDEDSKPEKAVVEGGDDKPEKAVVNDEDEKLEAGKSTQNMSTKKEDADSLEEAIEINAMSVPVEKSGEGVTAKAADLSTKEDQGQIEAKSDSPSQDLDGNISGEKAVEQKQGQTQGAQSKVASEETSSTASDVVATVSNKNENNVVQPPSNDTVENLKSMFTEAIGNPSEIHASSEFTGAVKDALANGEISSSDVVDLFKDCVSFVSDYIGENTYSYASTYLTDTLTDMSSHMANLSDGENIPDFLSQVFSEHEDIGENLIATEEISDVSGGVVAETDPETGALISSEEADFAAEDMYIYLDDFEATNRITEYAIDNVNTTFDCYEFVLDPASNELTPEMESFFEKSGIDANSLMAMQEAVDSGIDLSASNNGMEANQPSLMDQGVDASNQDPLNATFPETASTIDGLSEFEQYQQTQDTSSNASNKVRDFESSSVGNEQNGNVVDIEDYRSSGALDLEGYLAG